MRWRAIGPNTIESDAGYRVLRCTENGKETGRFVCFRGKTTTTESPVVLGGWDNADDARKCCEAHYAKTSAE
jgi:hypothetical protein